MGVRCGLLYSTGLVNMVRYLYVGPVHHDIILGMSWMTQCKVRIRSQHEVIEVCTQRSDERVHLPMPLPAATLSYVRGVKSASQDKKGDVAPKQHRRAAWNGEDTPELGHSGCTKAAIVGHSLQPTPNKQRK